LEYEEKYLGLAGLKLKQQLAKEENEEKAIFIINI
jgi:hypothetical protein